MLSAKGVHARTTCSPMFRMPWLTCAVMLHSILTAALAGVVITILQRGFSQVYGHPEAPFSSVMYTSSGMLV